MTVMEGLYTHWLLWIENDTSIEHAEKRSTMDGSCVHGFLQLIGTVVARSQGGRCVQMIEKGRTTPTAGPSGSQLDQSLTYFHKLSFEFDTIPFGQSEISHDLGIGNLEQIHLEDQFRVSLILCHHSDLGKMTVEKVSSRQGLLDCQRFGSLHSLYEQTTDRAGRSFHRTKSPEQHVSYGELDVQKDHPKASTIRAPPHQAKS